MYTTFDSIFKRKWKFFYFRTSFLSRTGENEQKRYKNLIHFWKKSKNFVHTRYLTFIFLLKAKTWSKVRFYFFYFTFSINLSLNSSKPCDSLTEINTQLKSEYFSLNCAILSSSILSILLNTKILSWCAQISLKTLWTTSILSSTKGSLASITWSKKSDSILSSRVEEKDFTNFGGKSLINPIVSLSKTSLPSQVSGFVIK